jgi:hypothetical protein
LLSFSNEEEGGEGDEGSAENILPTKMISAPIIRNNQKKSNSKKSNNQDVDNYNDNSDKKDKNGKKSEIDIKIDEEKYQKMLQDAKKKAAQYNFDDDEEDDDEEEVKGGSSSGGGGGEEEGEKRGGEEGGAGHSFRSHYEDSEEAIKKKMLKDKGDYCLVMNVVSVHNRRNTTHTCMIRSLIRT